MVESPGSYRARNVLFQHSTVCDYWFLNRQPSFTHEYYRNKYEGEEILPVFCLSFSLVSVVSTNNLILLTIAHLQDIIYLPAIPSISSVSSISSLTWPPVVSYFTYTFVKFYHTHPLFKMSSSTEAPQEAKSTLKELPDSSLIRSRSHRVLNLSSNIRTGCAIGQGQSSLCSAQTAEYVPCYRRSIVLRHPY